MPRSKEKPNGKPEAESPNQGDALDPELVKLLGPSLKAAAKTAKASLRLSHDVTTAMYAAVEAQHRANMEAQAQTVRLINELHGQAPPTEKKSSKK